LIRPKEGPPRKRSRPRRAHYIFPAKTSLISIIIGRVCARNGRIVVFWLLSAHTAQSSGGKRKIEARREKAEVMTPSHLPRGRCRRVIAILVSLLALFAVLSPEIVLRRVSVMAFCAQLAYCGAGKLPNSKCVLQYNAYILDRISRGTKNDVNDAARGWPPKALGGPPFIDRNDVVVFLFEQGRFD
jgi:hypothetical protein